MRGRPRHALFRVTIAPDGSVRSVEVVGHEQPNGDRVYYVRAASEELAIKAAKFEHARALRLLSKRKQTQRLREAQQSNETCVTCCRTPPVPGYSKCARCRKNSAATRQRRRDGVPPTQRPNPAAGTVADKAIAYDEMRSLENERHRRWTAGADARKRKDVLVEVRTAFRMKTMRQLGEWLDAQIAACDVVKNKSEAAA